MWPARSFTVQRSSLLATPSKETQRGDCGVPSRGSHLTSSLAKNHCMNPSGAILLTVVRVYDRGRKLSEEELRSAEGVVGDLRTQTVQINGRDVSGHCMGQTTYTNAECTCRSHNAIVTFVSGSRWEDTPDDAAASAEYH